MRRARKFFGTGTSPGLGARRRPRTCWPTTWCTSRWVRPPVEGKAAVMAAFASRFGGDAARPEELHIHNIITHGNTAALNASLLMPGGRVEYCHFYLFNGFAKSAKLKRITEYRIETGAN